MPRKQPKRRRLWLNDGSCVRLRPERKNHVWSYDFMMDRTHNGRPFRMLTMLDEYTRECLAIDVGRRLRSDDVLEHPADLFIRRGVPGYIRSDNGPEFTAEVCAACWLGLESKRFSSSRGAPGRTGTSSRLTGNSATSS